MKTIEMLRILSFERTRVSKERVSHVCVAEVKLPYGELVTMRMTWDTTVSQESSFADVQYPRTDDGRI